jgi:hypothetical protein
VNKDPYYEAANAYKRLEAEHFGLAASLEILEKALREAASDVVRRPTEPSEGAILAAEQAYKDGPDDEPQFDAIKAAVRAAYMVDFGPDFGPEIPAVISDFGKLKNGTPGLPPLDV